jgi:hypothetical protein
MSCIEAYFDYWDGIGGSNAVNWKLWLDKNGKNTVIRKKDEKKSGKIKIDQNWDKIEVILYIIIKIQN